MILTGAGISRESGLSTFRDSGGLWRNVRVEDVATPEGFARDPHKVHEFYNARRRLLLSGAVAPNAAHHALAKLERMSRRELVLVTQNVDDLHERAGSKNVLHMHGELLQAVCARCREVLRCDHDLSARNRCPSCRRVGTLRPHVVWFGEIPLHMEEIGDALGRCGIFVSIGTSGSVHPAAGFASRARERGAHVVELNLEPSLNADVFHEKRYGKASVVVPEWVDAVLEREK
jgi:NAD-dependent deacetylase